MFYYAGKLNHTNTIELDITDSTWLYGANIFTTMRVYAHSLEHPLTNYQKHLERLKSSIKSFNWKQPNWQTIEQETQDLCQHFPVIRLTLFPDGRELIIGRNLPDQLIEKQTKGIKGLVCLDSQLQRVLPDHKTGNYLTPWLALQQAKQQGYQEAILTGIEQEWLETSTGNLWGYKDGVWYTPDLAVGILPGVARRMIMEKAKGEFNLQQNHWTTEFINQLEAIAYSNSVVEIIPFKTIVYGNQTIELDVNHSAYKSIKNLYQNF